MQTPNEIDPLLPSPRPTPAGEVELETTGTPGLTALSWSLLRDSIPVIVSYILQNSIQTASILIAGRLGPDELSVAAFAQMLAFVTGWCVALGGTTALDTLGSQAYTGGHITALSIHFQRCVVILWVLFIPVAITWWFMHPILVALGQSASLSHDTQTFLRILIAGAPGYIGFESLKKYLQCQGIMGGSTKVLAVVFPINIVGNIYLIHYTRLGVFGAAVAVSSMYWLCFILLGWWTWSSPVHRANGTWGGLRPWAALNPRSCYGFIKLAIPGILMVGTEWAAFEIVALAAGRLGALSLAAQSVIMTTDQILNTIPFGQGVAASARVGNLIGARSAVGAKHAAHASAFVSVIVGFVVLVLMMATKDGYGYLFSDDVDVVRLVAKVMPLVASFQVADGLAGSCGGVLRGQGRQHLGALFNCVAYYLLALPLGITLAFSRNTALGLQGLWIGQVVALFLVGLAEFYVVFRSDWDEEPEALSSMTALAYPLPSVSSATVTNTASLLKIVALCLISGAAIASRLFAVINFESIIHEFDPWFNYRATRVLAYKGFYEFWNWFDPTAWYPLGRVVGGTVYPGIMATSGVIYNFLHALNIPVDIRNVCVMLAPGFSALTAWSTYMFTKEMKDESAGLLAAAFIGIVPGYISRSVAGSYDNEAIAIFLLMFTFYLWIKALKVGSALFGTLAAVFYFYMVSAWGGYVFITNMIPLHSLVLILMGRFSSRLYVAYTSWYAIGTLSSMQVPFVGFQPVSTSEHMAALGVFGLLQIVAFIQLVRSHVSSKQFQDLLFISAISIGVLGAVGIIGLTYTGKIAPWTGRFYSLWDTGYAKKHIPIIASVSEHQPTAWPSFFMDLQFLIFFVPRWCFMASYFAGVMHLRSPSPPFWTHISTPGSLKTLTKLPKPTLLMASLPLKKLKKAVSTSGSGGALTDLVAAAAPEGTRSKGIYGLDTRLAVILNAIGMLAFFVHHCTWATSGAYSSPSVVLASQNADGSQHIIDDFREAYYWLRQNTPETAVVMSWWDYGYQIAGMADRPTLVDNNTWNNTHIATVGKAMSSTEEVAYPILRKHDVDYVLIIFGGLLGYSGDDINKFLWMVRIAQGIWPEEIQEPNYFTPQGEYRVDDMASTTMKNSLMYKMSYYRFAELFGGGNALDRVRNQHVPKVGPTLDYLDEAYTTENWIVRGFDCSFFAHASLTPHDF
ncbi:hypothetical protein MIND_00317600 [Mycena indigotica]|uniref:Dolichyl-diphosphooligosaccharide--protein glycosyltransferase subunit STT3 n=1 Tax=Mycena indigotica TaxID=2126181 RepID=A0A8H6WC78_9AGAR|nr:uncharacterized protein MIND_00317600 [Mycena indigotica]KAF7309468.1 hypothetical protein MIND_00317600 [Mycena indigotica]